MLSLGISVAAINCNSLNVSLIKNQDFKLCAIINYKTDVILLSDIRLNGKPASVLLSLVFGIRSITTPLHCNKK
jgi:hypothetical protein